MFYRVIFLITLVLTSGCVKSIKKKDLVSNQNYNINCLNIMNVNIDDLKMKDDFRKVLYATLLSENIKSTSIHDFDKFESWLPQKKYSRTYYKKLSDNFNCPFFLEASISRNVKLNLGVLSAYSLKANIKVHHLGIKEVYKNDYSYNHLKGGIPIDPSTLVMNVINAQIDDVSEIESMMLFKVAKEFTKSILQRNSSEKNQVTRVVFQNNEIENTNSIFLNKNLTIDEKELLILDKYNKLDKSDNSQRLDMLSELIELNPENNIYYLEISKSYYDLNEFEKSLDYLNQSLEIDAKYDYEKFIFAKNVFKKNNDVINHLNVLEILNKNNYSMDIETELIETYYSVGRYKKIIEIYENKKTLNLNQKFILLKSYVSIQDKSSAIVVINNFIDEVIKRNDITIARYITTYVNNSSIDQDIDDYSFKKLQLELIGDW